MLVHGQEGPFFTSGGSDLQVCRCTPGLWPITPLQLKVLLQAGVADLIPVGGSGLRCVADFWQAV